MISTQVTGIKLQNTHSSNDQRLQRRGRENHSIGFVQVKSTILKYMVFSERFRNTMSIYNFKHNVCFKIQSDQKFCVHLMITLQKNTQKYFKQFQSLTMIT
jgi:hypothetical protein